MKVEFLKRFSKDLDDIGTKSVKISLIKTIELIESAKSLEDIPNTKNSKAINLLIEQGWEIID